MGRQGRILIVDDKQRWRDTLQEVFVRGGYMADAAGSIEEAQRLLAESFYHLLVLDIRLEDDDAANVEGMDLLRSIDELGGADAVRVIMLSAYGSKEQMREAFRDRHVEDFLTKEDFDDIEFLEQVQTIFARKILINLGLSVSWRQVAGPQDLVVNIRYGEKRIARGEHEQRRRAAEELDDLLCRLFYQCHSLLVQPLTAGHSAAGVLLAERFDASGSAPPVVVKFGDARAIRAEHAHFRQYIEGRLGGGRTTSVIDTPRYTPRLGGIVYSMLGASGERFETFERFYQRAEADQIKSVLQNLFFETCRSWYDNPGVRRVHNLTEEYLTTLGLSAERLELVLDKRLLNVQGRQKLQFLTLGPEHQFTNPILLLGQPPFLRSTLICATHGDLHAQNLLVDSDLHTWLIDFLRTGPGHILRDVACLDTAVRIQLLAADEASLEERWGLERSLGGVSRFSELDRIPPTLTTANQKLRKAYEVSLYLRQVARQVVLRSEDFSEYLVASFYYALNLTRFSSWPKVQREHALLAASLMADQLMR